MTTREEGLKNLLILADYLDSKVERKNFFLGNWGMMFDNDKPIPPGVRKTIPVDCGFTACALGHSTMVPAFRRMGLGFVIDNGVLKGTWKGVRGDFSWRDAAKEIFAVDYSEFSDLFVHGYRTFGLSRPTPTHLTPKQYAKGLRKWVKDKTNQSW